MFVFKRNDGSSQIVLGLSKFTFPTPTPTECCRIKTISCKRNDFTCYDIGMNKRRASQLSLRARSIWAKTASQLVDGKDELTGYQTLAQHMVDSSDVAGLLYDQWLSPRIVGDLKRHFGENARTVVMFLAGVHDLGKAGPAFEKQSIQLARRLFDVGLNVNNARTVVHQSEFPHSAAGQNILTHYAKNHLNSAETISQLASVVGAHHGVPVGAQFISSYLRRKGNRTDRLGTGEWWEVQDELLEWQLKRHAVELEQLENQASQLDRPTLSILTGLVIVADWIASNADLFPLRGIEDSYEPLDDTGARAIRAWEALQFPHPWKPVATDELPDAMLEKRFRFTSDVKAHPVQSGAVEVAHKLGDAGIMIIEEQTGSGKTEAALMAAEILAHKSNSSGIQIGLPTMATANAMMQRVIDWLANVPGNGSAEGGLVLAHSKERLEEASQQLRATKTRIHQVTQVPDPFDDLELSAIGEPKLGQISDVHDDVIPTPKHRLAPQLKPSSHEWMYGTKKRNLANFVVGTIDQLLFLALKSRHVMLRHLGIAGKVVIIDEVHAADAYMREFLHAAVEWMGRFKVPIIVLTATLPSSQRTKLLDAYKRGLALNMPTESQCDPPQQSKQPNAYPLITFHGTQSSGAVPLPSADNRRVELIPIDDDIENLSNVITGLVSGGGCVLVIRNTVKRAQETTEFLKGRFGTKHVTIAHSRFTAFDRAENDRWLRETFGPRATNRPHFHIVVGTQVLEQSLDVDFDALFTDICPVDLLIQRIGRMHRHTFRKRPELLKQPRCFITGVKAWQAQVPEPLPDFKPIYSPYEVLRTIMSLRLDKGATEISTPGDTRQLIEDVYVENSANSTVWAEALEQARTAHLDNLNEYRRAASDFVTSPIPANEDEQFTIEKYGLSGWLDLRGTDNTDAIKQTQALATVRYGAPTFEVVLVQTDGTSWRVLDTSPKRPGELIPDLGELPYALAEVVAQSAVSLPIAMCTGDTGTEIIKELERITDAHATFCSHPLLQGQLALPLDENFTTKLCQWVLTYSPQTGLHTEKERRG